MEIEGLLGHVAHPYNAGNMRLLCSQTHRVGSVTLADVSPKEP